MAKKKQAGNLDELAQRLANEEDEDSKIARMIRSMPKWRFYLLAAISIFWLLFQLRIKLYKPFEPWFQLPLHLCLALYVVFLMNPLADKYKKNWLWIVDGALIVMVSVILQYFVTHAEYLNNRMYSVSPVTTHEIIVAVFLLITILEAVRRVVSVALFGVIVFFMGYAWFGQFIPGVMHYQGISFDRFCETLMLGTNGIFGSPLGTSLNTLFYFLLFGSFFANCGGGAVLIDAGLKLSNKTVGGPAKAAVLSSGLMGMISGSAVANVSSTGVFTIPLMKKTGYAPEEAGAIESVASTGGQIMPPIMGAGAFIMAEMIGLQYIRIAASAVIPAIAYFGSAYILVHLIARKRRIGHVSGVAADTNPVLPRIYRLFPIVLLVILIVRGTSIPRSALICTVVSIAISMICQRHTDVPEEVCLHPDGRHPPGGKYRHPDGSLRHHDRYRGAFRHRGQDREADRQDRQQFPVPGSSDRCARLHPSGHGASDSRGLPDREHPVHLRDHRPSEPTRCRKASTSRWSATCSCSTSALSRRSRLRYALPRIPPPE